MVGPSSSPTAVRLAEIIAAMALATDLGMAQPMGHGLRTCLLASRLAEVLDLSENERRDVYYVALLRRVGCTSDAHELTAWFSDDHGPHARVFVLDFGRPQEVVLDLLRNGGAGKPLLAKARTVARAIASGRQGLANLFRASCEVAQQIAVRLDLPPGVPPALAHVSERWDGRGFPNGVKGEGITLSTRVVQLAEDMEVTWRHSSVGMVDATARARRLAGRKYDPAIANAFCRAAPDLFESMDSSSPWDAVLAIEPGPRHAFLSGPALDEALLAMADFTDLKSPAFSGHSRGVADIAAEASRRLRLPETEVKAVWRAGAVHDIGRVGVSNGVWEKPGPLNDGEWEQARLHPYYTERVFARSEALAPLGALAAFHHERLDGSGYHRGVPAPSLPLAARILAAADAYRSKIEPRPYRPPLSPHAAADELQREARFERLDQEAVEAVLNAAGHPIRLRRQGPAGLTEREVEVLRLIAQGHSKRQIAEALTISEHTADHHVRNIYDKLGVSTRAAATLFAMRHDLLTHADLTLPAEK